MVSTRANTKKKADVAVRPLADRVVIRPSDDAEAMKGGLYIPDTAQEKPCCRRLGNRYDVIAEWRIENDSPTFAARTPDNRALVS